MGHHDADFEEYDQMDPRESGSERSISKTSGRATQQPQQQQQQSQSGRGGGWTGYVMPYRYYGPGYRGVGYYSVMYQGSDNPDAGRTGQSGRRFDETDVRYGQGQGAGAAWGGGSQETNDRAGSTGAVRAATRARTSGSVKTSATS